MLTRQERERQTRENEIVQAAESIFNEKGYHNASMDEIAEKAQFTKRTLYQYFKSKEDLYFAVVVQGHQKLFRFLQSGLERGGNGFEKISEACAEYLRFYQQFPDFIRLLNYLGYVKSKADPTPRREELEESEQSVFQAVAAAVEEGKDDGSIKPEAEAEMTAYSLVYLVTGFFNQFSLTGKTFTQHLGLEPEKFIAYSLNLLLDSIRSPKEALK